MSTVPHLTALQTSMFKKKASRKLSFEDLGKILGQDEIYAAAIFYGQAKPSQSEIETLGEALGIPSSYLQDDLGDHYFPHRGGLTPFPPTDPVLYRLYEVIQVFGYPIKAVIHEKFGDGIMSAIDFSAKVDKVEHPKGDRVKITLDGKFLPYNTQWPKTD